MANPIAIPGTNVRAGAGVSPGGAQGIQGIQGIQGVQAGVSADSGNIAKLGSDSQIYVPVQAPKMIYYPTQSGTANAIILTNSPPITSGNLISGTIFYFYNSGGRNTGPTTINIDGTGAFSVVYNNGNACVGGEIGGTTWTAVVFVNGTGYVLLKSWSDRKFWFTSVCTFTASLANPTLNTNVQFANLAIASQFRGTQDATISGTTMTPNRDGILSVSFTPDRQVALSRLVINNGWLSTQQDTGSGTVGMIYNTITLPVYAGQNVVLYACMGTACNVSLTGLLSMY